MTTVDLHITAGLPYHRRMRIVGGASAWPTLQHFEVKSHVRSSESHKATLRFDFTPFLSREIDGSDIVVDLKLTGKDTKSVKSGYYDLIISDVGEVDARAIPVLSGRVILTRVVTEVFVD